MGPLMIIAALAVFLIVVLFHEGGHFLAAKSVGIRVNEFAIGMGPKLLGTTRGDTLYSLRLLPIGGYCAMEGEDDESDSPDSFDRAKPWQRFITILAGPLMNLVIAFVCFAVFTGTVGKPIPVVESVIPGSALEEAGFRPDDKITAINGKKIDSMQDLQLIVQADGAKEMEIEYVRDGQTKTARVTPKVDPEAPGKYMIGIRAKTVVDVGYTLSEAWSMLWKLFFQLFTILGMLFTGKLSLGAVSGPVGVVKVIGEAAQQGIQSLLFLTGYISLNLAFFNLLPIPALDGSKLLLIIVEKLRGKPMNKTLENRITMGGFIFLLGLLLLVSVKDVITLF